jgi:hypothetical protein
MKVPWLGVVVGALLCVTGAFYVWTAATSSPIHFNQQQSDKFNKLTDAFLHGQLSLLDKPAPGLAAIPSDQVGNDALVGPWLTSDTRDLSIYHGRFYLYWGPTPVLTSFLPFRALGLGDLPESLAVVLYTFFGLVFALLLARVLVRRFLPEPPAWAWALIVVALALGDVAPFVLRRPSVYEVAVSSGFCFLFAGLWLTASGWFRERPSWWRLGLGSLCFGLAFAARPNAGIGILAGVAVPWTVWRGAPDRGERARAAAILLGPFVAVFVAHLVYNALRFSGPLDFGTDYLLPVGRIEHNRPSYVLPGLWYYLIELPRLSLQFPYVFLGPPPVYPGHLPAGYVGEPTGGILPMIPLVLLLAAVPFWRRDRPELARLVLAGVAGAVFVLLFLVLRFPSATQRYELDFLPALLLGALLSWLALRRRTGRLLDGGVIALAVITCVLGVAASITGYYGLLRTNHPKTFDDLPEFFSPLPTLATQIAGNPAIVAMNDDPGLPPQRYFRLTIEGSGQWLGTSPATLQVISPSARTARLRFLAVHSTRAHDVPLRIAIGSQGAPRVEDVADRVIDVPVHLAKGRNTITLALQAGASLPFAPDDPANGQLARVEDLRLS